MAPDTDDLARIKELHAADERAALAQDHEALARLWSRDGVMIAPGAPPVRGGELLRTLRARVPDPSLEILEYELDFEEVTVAGDYAFEWGAVRGRTRNRYTGAIDTAEFRVLRVLRKEDGEWKVHRSIWN